MKALAPILIFLVLFGKLVGADESSRPFWGSAKSQLKAGLLLAKRTDSPPPGVTKVFPKAQFTFYSIDLDGDNVDDFIVESKKDEKTCFVKSDLSLKHCESLNLSQQDGFSYMYFAKLGGTITLFDFSGDEDRSDYLLRQVDPKTLALNKGIALHPFIFAKSEGGIYWGYPWDITGLIVQTENGKSKIKAAFDSALIDDVDSAPGAGGVAILFEGTPTQSDPKAYDRMKSLGKFKFLSVPEILSAAVSSGKVKKK